MADTKPNDEQAVNARAATALAQLLDGLHRDNPFNTKEEDKRR